ncbi:hypothetical protein LRS13_22045 [Svornostia abyssi]|uniref:Uncharacterized protein n=1 Tax=Svornostia abyssi TaxID=2898438 RepID=A0ABY5PFB6_9ACTN|nr:hypothetical protein LRS13_22045 [Parviterribacteraceae bacterium J379]
MLLGVILIGGGAGECGSARAEYAKFRSPLRLWCDGLPGAVDWPSTLITSSLLVMFVGSLLAVWFRRSAIAVVALVGASATLTYGLVAPERVLADRCIENGRLVSCPAVR